MHELEIINGKASFVSHREPAWHGLGTIVEDAMTSEQALALASLDWEVKLAPATCEIDGRIISVPRKRVTYRDDPISGQPVPLGIVGDFYRPIQNKDAFQILDEIVDSRGANYETAGVLKGGRQVFMTMTMPENILVGGSDPVNVYLSALTSHDGSKPLQVMVTPVRIVCANTARMAVTGAQSIYAIRHFANATQRVEEAKTALNITDKYLDEWQSIANRLADIDITANEFDEFLTEFIPAGESKVSNTHAENTREAIGQIYYSSPTQTDIIGTAWGAYNAVTEYFDHVRPVRSLKADLRRADAMFDERLTTKKDRAVKLLLAK